MLIALVGLNANAAIYLVGNAPLGEGWDPSKGIEMTDNNDGTYSFTTTINGTVWFCFADGLGSNNGDWDNFNQNFRFGPQKNGANEIINVGTWTATQKQGNGNGSYQFEGTGGEYVVTFDLTNMQFKIEGYVAPIVYDVYSVAGTPASIFGAEWSETNTETEMTLVNGLYTWTKEGVELANGTNIQFKVVGNHDWGHAWPGSNYSYDITESGTYDLAFTFDAEAQEVGFTATKVADGPAVDDYYIVAGTENLFGSNWNEKDSLNLMTEGENGIFTWTKEGFEATAGTEVEFKVVANGNWNTCWPLSDENGDNNWWYQFTQDGTYDIVITFNEETKDINMTATKQGEEPPVEMIYTVVGPETIFGSDWDETDQENDMVKGQDGIYTWTKSDVALYGNFEFKVVGNHDYEIYEWPIGMNNWVANVAEDGLYTILITFDPEAADADRITCTLTKTGDVEPIEHVYTVAGTENLFGSNWDTNDEANNMVKNENGIYVWTKNGVEFAEAVNIQFKVVQDHAWTYAWPSSNWNADLEAGKYNIVITFDPTADDMNKVTFTATPVVDPAYIRGDVNMDETVSIGDVTALIDYLLTQDATGVNLDAADCNLDEGVTIGDVTALIDFLLTNEWPAE